jgi:hypothetical protein
MSLIQQTTTVKNYDVSLDTMKQLIAADLGVPAEEINVTYVEGDVGPGDPMDRFPAPRGVVRIRVTHTKKV